MKNYLRWLLIPPLLMMGSIFNTAFADSNSIHHIVMLWFPPTTSVVYLEEVIQKTRQLADIEGVHNLKVGTAINSERTIVDDSFDIGISMQFNSLNDMKRYLKHPRHQAFVKRYIKGKASRLVVYDF